MASTILSERLGVPVGGVWNREAFDSLPQTVMLLAMDGTILDCNQATLVYMGLARDQVVGRRFVDLGFLSADDVTRSIELLDRLGTGQAVTPITVKVTLPGGLERWGEFWGGQIRKDDQVQAIVVTGRDVTDRKVFEEAYRVLVDQSLQGLIILQDKRVVFANQAVADITGYSVEELKAMTTEQALATIHPDDLDIVADRYSARLAGEPTPRRYTIRGIHKDGRQYCAEIHSQSITYHGRPAVQVTVLDITEKRRAEQALQESEARYRTLVQNANDIIYTGQLDPPRLTSVNAAVERILGYSAEEAIGANVDDYLPPEARRVSDEMFQRKIQGEPHTSYELTLPAKDGRMVPLEINSWLVFKDGRPIAFQGIARDITRRKQAEKALEIANEQLERRVEERTAELAESNRSLHHEIAERLRAEEALRRSERHFRSLIENASDLIVILSEDDRVRYASPSLKRLLGYSSEEYVGRNVFDLVHPEDLPRVLEAARRSNEMQGGNGTIECRYRHQDGSWRVLEVVGTNLLDDPDVQGTVLNARDITDRRHAEELLRIQRDLAVALATTHRLDECLDRVLDAAMSIEGLDCGGVYLVDATTGKLELRSHHGLSDEFIRGVAHYKPDDPETQLILRGEPTYLGPGEFVSRNDHVRAREGLRALGVFPLKCNGRVIAALNVASHTLDSIPQVTRDNIEMIAAQLSGVLTRIEAERALHESERRFRSLVENATDAIAILNEAGTVEYVSPPLEKMLGYVPDDLLGKDAFAFVHPDDVETVRARFVAANRLPGHVENVEFRYRHKDGSWRHLEVTGTNRLHDPAVAGAVLNIRDVTERRRIEEQIRLLNVAVAQMSEGVAVTDMDGNLRTLNDAFANLHGYSREELIGRHLSVFHTPEQMPSVNAANDVLRRTGSFVGEIQHARRDGSTFPASMHNSLFRDEAGRLAGMIATLTDITEQKRAEQELWKSQELLRKTFAALREGVFIIDSDTNVILDCNPAASLLFGYDHQEMVGRTTETLHVDEASLEEFRQYLVSAADRDGYLFLPEFRMKRKDGHIFPTEHSVTPILDERGSRIGWVSVVRDITDRKRAEEALRESEEKYRNIFNNAQVGIFRTRISDGRILESNDRHARMYGYDDTAEFIREFATSEHFVDPEGRRKMLDSFRDGELKDFETCLTRRDGSTVWISLCARMYPDKDYIEGAVSDITERKRAAEALQESEERFRQMAENIQEVFWMADASLHRILYVSPAYENLYGRTCRSVLEARESWLDAVHPEDRESAKKGVAQNQQGHFAEVEYRVVRPDGSIRWVRDRAFPIRDDRGTIYRIAGIAQDITERKAVEEALLHSERYFRSLIENSSDMISILDSDGTIRYESPSVQKVLGYSSGERLGRNALEALHPDDAPRLKAIQADLVVTPGRRVQTEFRYRHRDGSWRILEATATNLLNDPVVAGLVINSRDVTDRKRAEEARLVLTRSMDHSSEGILITDADIRITYANKAAQDLIGCPSDEMIGRRPDEVVETDPHTKEDIRVGVQRHRNWSGLVEVRNPRGDVVGIELTSLLISDEQDTPIATVNLLRDARQTRRLESLQHMAEVVAGTEATDEKTIDRIMSHLPELLSLDMWGIYLYNPEHDALEIRFFSQAGRELAEAVPTIPIAGSLQGDVFRTGEIVFSHDVANDHRFTRSPLFRKLLPIASRIDMKATCLLPIRSGGRILGTLNVSDRRVRTFSPEELTTLKTLASQIGVLLARLETDRSDRSRPSRTEPTEAVSIVAESEAMRMVLRLAARLAATDMPLVILGATGAGKGHLAKYIHSISPRRHGPFLSVNCACLDGELILSELFGHERGAFTGAVRQQKGCFELANGGTLLLDEVVELPSSAQAKLLQLVETQQFRRLGGQETITTDVRVMCTTNADVRECVRIGKMRQDLYYRLNAGEIMIPPLSERPDDIEPLAQAFLRTHALTTGGPIRLLSEPALARLREYHWPGNVRELQNVLAMAIAHGGRIIGVRDLHFAPAHQEASDADGIRTSRNERELILDALRRNRWNRSLAAEELGIHRNTLRHRMRKYGIVE